MDISDTATAFDSAAGVVAHGLLNTMTVISGAAQLLRNEWDVLSAERRAEVFSLIETHAAEASMALVTIVQGLPPEALELLEELSLRRDAARAAATPPVRLRGRRREDEEAASA
jgi:hypothetical protein